MSISGVNNASASVPAKLAATPAAKPAATPAATPVGAPPAAKPTATPAGGTPVGGTPSGSVPLSRQVQTDVARNGPLLLASVNNLGVNDTPFKGALATPVGVTPGGTPGVGVLANTPAGATPGGGLLPIISDKLNGTDKVNAALKEISNDPDGQKLLQLAQSNGYRISITDDPPNMDSVATTLGGDNKIILVNPNRQGFGGGNLTTTLAHELVHAATEGDGDSYREEALAETIGLRISNRAAGKPLTAEQETATYKKLYSDVKNLYKDDPSVKGVDDNGIFDNLAKLGIDTAPAKAGLPAIPALSIQKVTFDQFDSVITGQVDGKISKNDIEKFNTGGTNPNAVLAKILAENYADIAGADNIIDLYDLVVLNS